MWRYVYLLFLYTNIYVFCSQDESRVVKITQGPVRGYKTDGLYAFNGIPYATAPSGEDKFKAPLPAPKWTETFEANNIEIVCPQVETDFVNLTNKIMQEDCLIANVYVPDVKDKDLSVVIYVHGGGFHAGYGDNFKPTQLVKSQNIIAITFNYRLGINGFLCLGTETAPGNAGLKDQVALLRWVKENIASFGGNPAEVTIAGYSAGAVSVDLLMLSKSAKGLFNKVIPESGGHIAPFSVQIDPIKIAKDYARSKNFTNVDDINALGKFYATAGPENLIFNYFMDSKNSEVIFAPCVERDIGVERFLEEAPINILKRGDFEKLPVLVGFANMEGMIRLKEFLPWHGLMDADFSDFLPVDLQFDNDNDKKLIANKAKQFYFNDQPVEIGTILSYIDYYSDIGFVSPHIRSIKLQLEAGNDQIYLYEFSFVNEDFPKIPFFDLKGAGHCYQTAIIMDVKAPQEDESTLLEESKEMRKFMRELWGNFIKTGKPVPDDSQLPKWPAVGLDISPYMSLGQTVELKKQMHLERMSFWDEIYKKHYRPPMAPMSSAPASAPGRIEL